MRGRATFADNGVGRWQTKTKRKTKHEFEVNQKHHIERHECTEKKDTDAKVSEKNGQSSATAVAEETTADGAKQEPKKDETCNSSGDNHVQLPPDDETLGDNAQHEEERTLRQVNTAAENQDDELIRTRPYPLNGIIQLKLWHCGDIFDIRKLLQSSVQSLHLAARQARNGRSRSHRWLAGFLTGLATGFLTGLATERLR
mmetsp:Transcript_102054/g.176056  ORF Transcript_102054/g.176056 Transcript_102054/m.176056 type:complete len:200 (-) Transcript_102054:200-799(-)